VRHETNRGVGGALKTGYTHARDDGMDVTVVLAGDGQMDPDLLERVIDPIVDGTADYVKGNRLLDPDHRAGMPRFRLIGNLLLTALTKVASGYWRIGDPQNGYTAISGRALDAVDVESLYEFYGYCNELLVRLNVNDMTVADVPMPAVYGDEESHIRYRSYVPRVSAMLLRNFLWRLSTAALGGRRPLAFLYGLGGVGLGGSLLSALRRRADGVRPILAWGLLGVLSLLLAVHSDRAANREIDAGAVDPDEDRSDGADR